MTSGRVIVVSGLPGAGKTTTAQLLAARFDRAAHIEADEIHQMIVTGRDSPTGYEGSLEDIGTEAAHQLRLRLRNSVLVARSFADAGIDAIVDDMIIGQRVDELLDTLQGIDFWMVTLKPDFSTLVDRWRAIDSPFVEAWAWMDDELRLRTQAPGLWLDTTSHTPEQVVDDILARLDEAHVGVKG